MPLLPLEGYTIGVTADRRWAEQAELLERRGATVIHGPTITTEYLGADDTLRAATEAVIADPPAYLVATTGIGMRAWFEAAQAWGLVDKVLEALAATRVVARGAKATAAVQSAGLSVWAIPPSERLDEAVALLAAEPLDGRIVAFQNYGERDLGALAAIADRGGRVVEVPVYRYRPPADDTKAKDLIVGVCGGQIDAVTFTSAPAIDNLFAIARRHGRAAELLAAFNLGGTAAACIGPVCAEAALGAGVERPLTPDRGRLGLLVRTLSDALQARRRILRTGTVSIVLQGQAVLVDDTRVDLPRRERAVLAALARRPGIVVSKRAILDALPGDQTTEHALETAVGRLRRHLGHAGLSIRTVRGRGYCFDADEQA